MASSITFSGIGSTIDFGTIRDAIITDRMRPIAALQTRTANLTSQSGALKQLNGLLATLTAAGEALTDTSLGSRRSATSSSSSILTASATETADSGSLTVTVTRLASSLSQASRSFGASSEAVLANGASLATFELRQGGAGSGVEITIDSDNNSLNGLRDAINTADAGVKASIVDLTGDGTQNQLVLTSTETGAVGRVQLVETTATGTGAGLNIRSLNPPGATNDFSMLDAQLTIGGLSITRSTNTISDAVAGLTLTLRQTGEATITIGQSTEITDKLQTFINAYNAVQDFALAQYKKDAENRPIGVLAGDPTLRIVQRQLRDALSTVSGNNGGSLTRLSDLGIGRDENGKLTLDKTTLENAMKTKLGDVQALLFGKTSDLKGLFNEIHSVSNTLSDSVTGMVQTAITGFDSSVKSIARSVAEQTRRINELRDILTRQFSKLDAAIGQLNNQGTTLTTIMDALKPKRS